MNESAAFSESDKIDTDELVNREPSAEEELATSQDPNEGREVVTGLIEHPSKQEQETAIIRSLSGIATGAITRQEPILKVAKICHVGAVRERNEDSCLLFQSEAGGHFALMPFGLYIVADGMGGHVNGHIASKIASRTAAQSIVDNIYMPLLSDEDTGIQTPIQEVMTAAVQTANAAVFRSDPDNDSGTTLTIALILGPRLYIAHVGDSRIYLFNEGKLEPVSTDHSLVQRLQDVGQMTAEEATIYQYRHVLLRAVGQTEQVDVDTYMRRLPRAGRLLLCSDGLPTMVSDAKIEEILAQNKPVEETANNLLQVALDAGGYDNITIILVDFTLQ